jgi:hypothetical protein
MRNTMITEGSDDEQYSSDESKSDSDLNDVETAPDRVTPTLNYGNVFKRSPLSSIASAPRTESSCPSRHYPQNPCRLKVRRALVRGWIIKRWLTLLPTLSIGCAELYTAQRRRSRTQVISVLELDEIMSKLDNDDNHFMEAFETIISHIYSSMELSDPEYNSDSPDEEEYIDSTEAPEPIRIDQKSGNDLLQEAIICAEVLGNLLRDTNTLREISDDEVKSMPKVITIPTTVKCKRKLKPDGSYDKHKARMAARGDLLV